MSHLENKVVKRVLSAFFESVTHAQLRAGEIKERRIYATHCNSLIHAFGS